MKGPPRPPPLAGSQRDRAGGPTHAGHADVLREGLDSTAGLRPDAGNLTRDGDADRAAHVGMVEAAAARFR